MLGSAQGSSVIFRCVIFIFGLKNPTVYVLKKEEGGRHSPFFAGYRPQFYMTTTDATGKVTKIMNDNKDEESKMVMPGDRVKMVVEIIMPVACEQGMRFAIRERGKTFGAGVIQSMIE